MMKYSLLLLIVVCLTTKSFSANNMTLPPGKLIRIVVNEKGYALIGRDTLTANDLSPELQRRLWKSYMGTGKMYDSIKLEFEGEVLMGTKGAAMDAIKEAQEKALKEICLEKHKKLFDALSEGQKNKIRKQFPVLFQTNYL